MEKKKRKKKTQKAKMIKAFWLKDDLTFSITKPALRPPSVPEVKLLSPDQCHDCIHVPGN